jgi:Xaa-Pro aminopeptidase
MPAPALPGGDDRRQLAFETLTFVPFDRRLILADRLSPGERAWLDAYHAEVLDKLGSRLSAEALDWCRAACAPL